MASLPMTECQDTLKLIQQLNSSESYLHSNFFKSSHFLLCCPALSPQIVGATVDAPPIVKVSAVQVPAVG